VTYYDEVQEIQDFISDLAMLQILNRKLEQATTNDQFRDIRDLSRDIRALRNQLIQTYADLYVAAHRDRSEGNPGT
jgi:hypothetical protein